MSSSIKEIGVWKQVLVLSGVLGYVLLAGHLYGQREFLWFSGMIVYAAFVAVCETRMYFVRRRWRNEGESPFMVRSTRPVHQQTTQDRLRQ